MGASASEVKAGGAYVEIGGRDKMLSTALASARGKLKRFGSTMNEYGRKFLKLGAITAAPLALGIKVASDFSEQMAAISTMLSESDALKFMPQFSREIRELSVEFGEGTKTIAKGMYDILSASVAPNKALATLRSALMGAKAGFTDTKDSAYATMTILNAYGLSADRATDVSDLLFSIVKRGMTEFKELAPQLGQVASTAASAGVSLEEFAAMLATGTRKGVPTAIAITALNSVLMAFIKSSDRSKEAAKEMGFELNTNTIRSIGLAGVMKKLEGATTEQIGAVFENRRALKLIYPILKGVQGFYKDIQIATNRAGTSQTAFTKATDTLAHSLRQLKQGFIDVARQIGLILTPETRALAGGIKTVLGYFTKILRDNPKLVRTYAKMSIALLGVGVALIGIGTTLKLLSPLLGPVGVFAAGAVILLHFSGVLKDVTDGIKTYFREIKIGGTTLGALLDTNSEIVQRLRDIWTEFKLFMKALWDHIAALGLKSLTNMMKAISGTIMDAMADMATGIDVYVKAHPGIDWFTKRMLIGLGNTAAVMNKMAADAWHEWDRQAELAAHKADLTLSKLETRFLFLKSVGESAAEGISDSFKDAFKDVDLEARLRRERQRRWAWISKLMGGKTTGAPPGLGASEAGAGAGGAVAGTFSGVAAAMLGPSIAVEQLNVSKVIRDAVLGIEKNTSGGTVATFGG